MDGVFEAEKVEDRAEKVSAFVMRQRVQERCVLPERIRCGNLVQVQIVDAEQGTLLKVRQHNPPTPPQIRDSTVEEVRLETLLVAPPDVRERWFLTAIRELEERQSKRLEHGLAKRGVIEGMAWRVLEGFVDACPQPHDLDEIVEMAGLQCSVLAVISEAQQLLVFGVIAGVIAAG